MMNIALISGGCSGDYSKIVGWRLWTLIKLCVRTKYIIHTHTHTHSFILNVDSCWQHISIVAV